MANRKIELTACEYYHIYNRGADKREVSSCRADYLRFLTSLGEFNRPEAIESLYRQKQLKKIEVEPLRLRKK